METYRFVTLDKNRKDAFAVRAKYLTKVVRNFVSNKLINSVFNKILRTVKIISKLQYSLEVKKYS